MKTGFSTCPVYVRTPKHIHAHFLTCYVALTITKLLERKYIPNITSQELFDVLRTTTYNKLSNDIWEASNVSDVAIKTLKKTGFKDLLYTHRENKTLNKIISTSKQKYI